MPDLAHPLLVYTNGNQGRQSADTMTRTPPISENVLAEAAPYYRRTPVYGRPSEQYATALYREQVVNVQAYHVSPPDRAEFQRRQIVWYARSQGKSRAPLGNDVQTQLHRTFGGFSKPYYQALKAPSLNDVARYMGGVINVNANS